LKKIKKKTYEDIVFINSYLKFVKISYIQDEDISFSKYKEKKRR
jgi:hypothetical protein